MIPKHTEQFDHNGNEKSKLMTWSKTWQLPFNTSKCKVLHPGSQNPETAYTILCQDNTIDLAIVRNQGN